MTPRACSWRGTPRAAWCWAPALTRGPTASSLACLFEVLVPRHFSASWVFCGFTCVCPTGTQKENFAERGDLADNTRVNYVTCNFQAESWEDKLREAGLDTALPSRFLWEGVTMYLPRQAVQQTLNRCRNLIDILCLTLLPRCAGVLGRRGDRVRILVAAHDRAARRATEAMEEPWLCGTDARGMEAMVEESGLSVLDNAAARDGRKKMLWWRQGPPGHTVGRYHRRCIWAANHGQ